MNPRRRIRNALSTLFAAALLCAAAGAPAQTVHRQVDGEGRITFSDLAGAAPASPASPDAAVPAPEAARVRKATVSPRRGAMVEANEAERRLRQARLARERGAEPLSGEQVRGAGAGAVNHRYWLRQVRLRREVEQALRRSNETRHSVRASR